MHEAETSVDDTLDSDSPGPVQLKVSYRSSEALLQAFTQSVARGSVDLPSRKNLRVGTRFHIQLIADEVGVPVDVFGEVTQAAPRADGLFTLTIRYDAGTHRAGLDATLRALFDGHQRNDRVRRHPRVPINVSAHEKKRDLHYLVRDVSRGGAGIEVDQPSLPAHIHPGQPVLMRLWMNSGPVGLHGEVAWTANPVEGGPPNASFGIRFGVLQKQTQGLLDRILVLYGLPNGPWKADVSFGMEAVEQMP